MNNYILKSIVVSLVGLLLFSTCDEPKEKNEEEETVVFVKTYGKIFQDIGYSVQQTTDGGYVITGSTKSFLGNYSLDVWLIKTDLQGNEQWNQSFGGNDDDWGRSVQQTIDGGYIITGSTWSFGNGEEEIWLIKADSLGNEVWNQSFGGINHDLGYSVQQTIDGGYIITGSTRNGRTEARLFKTDSNGNEEWNQTFGEGYSQTGYSVQQTTDGGYIITGTGSFGFGYDVWLIKTDSQGNEEWNRTFGGSGGDYGYSVQQTSDGGYIITGATYSFGNGETDVWLIKTDSHGQEEWNQTFGGSEIDIGRSVKQTIDGGFIITGSTTGSFGGPEKDIWLIKTDSQGQEEWNQIFGGSEWDEGYSVQQTTDGGYITAGNTDSYGNGGADVWLIKTDSEGNTVDYP